MPQLNGHCWGDLFSRNYVFKSGFYAWLLAQTMKVRPQVLSARHACLALQGACA
jgi:hypothetical protein